VPMPLSEYSLLDALSPISIFVFYLDEIIKSLQL